MKITKTQQRIDWLNENKDQIEKARSEVRRPNNKHKGHNAKGMIGMCGPGFGWWANALDMAGIKCNRMSYWSGSASTPSTAINAGIAHYILSNAPSNLL